MKYFPAQALFVAVILLATVVGVPAQEKRSNTFDETRSWLLKADPQSGNSSFRKLFEKGDERIDDLITALSDEEQKVSINSQRILRYLALQKGVDAIESKRWCRQTCSSPVLNVFERPIALTGVSSDPLKIAVANRSAFEASRFNSGDVSFRLLGHNKRSNVALLEVIQGQVFTAGWHSVIQWKDGAWWLISDTNLWVH